MPAKLPIPPQTETPRSIHVLYIRFNEISGYMQPLSFRLLLPFFVFTAASCGSVRVQVIEPMLDGSADGELLVHSGDSVQVSYWLWDRDGVMAFAIYNATDRPIYVDWYKCALVHNGGRLPYWSETRTTGITGFAQRSDISLQNVNSYLGSISTRSSGSSVFSGAMVQSKPERISFIPPRSSLFRNTRWNLLTAPIKNGQNWTKTVEPASYDSRRAEEVKVREYARDQSPLVFRNFVTWSFTDSFEQEHYVDDEFWVKRVSSMSEKQFKGKLLSSDSRSYEYANPYAAGQRFYIVFKAD